MADVKIKIDADGSGAVRELSDTEKALLKLIESEKKLATAKAAEEKFKAMSEAEREVFLASLKVSDGLEKVDDAARESATAAQEAQGGFRAFGLSLTDLKSGLELAQQALSKIQGVIDATVDKTVEYAEQVRDLGRISGASAEDTSRLIQTADDLKVSYETLTQASRKLAQEGIALTTEELAKLADEYVAIQDPAARSAFALEKFGRAGLEMTKVLEQGGAALREMAREQEGGLILTQEQIDAARELEKAQDELGDALSAVAVIIGNTLIPALTSLTRTLNDGLKALDLYINMGDKLAPVLKQHSNELKKSGVAWREYALEMIRAQAASAGFNLTYEEINALMARFGTNIDAVAEKLGYGTEQTYDHEQALQAVREEYDRQKSALQPTIEGYDDLNERLVDAAGKTREVAKSAAELQAAQLDLINSSMKPLTAEMLYQKAAAGLDAGAALELARSMGLINETTYTTLSRLQELREQYDSNRDGMIDATEAAKGYTQAVKELAAGDYLVKIRADFSDLERALAMAERLNKLGTANIIGPDFSWNNPKTGNPPTPPTPPEQIINGMQSEEWPGTQVIINGWQGDGASLAAEIERRARLARLLR